MWYLWDRRGVLASEEQSLEKFLPAVISASIEITFAVATLTGAFSLSQYLLLFLASTIILLIRLQEDLFFVILTLGRGSV